MEYPTYLIHYGIQGQKWGVRRFQNEDGTWTEDGLVRRRKDQKHLFNKQARLGKQFDKYTQKMESDAAKGKKISDRRINKAAKIGAKFKTLDYISKDPDTYFKARKLRAASAAKFGVNAATVAAGIGTVIGSNKEIEDISKAMRTTEDTFRESMNRIYKDDNSGAKRIDFIKKYVDQHEFDDKGRIVLQRGENKVPDAVDRYLYTISGENKFLNKINGKFDKDKFNKAIFGDIDFLEKSFNKWKNQELSDTRNFYSEKLGNLSKNLDNATRNMNLAGVFTAVNLGRTVSELVVEQHLIDKMLKSHYGKIYEKTMKEMTKDLKKHGFEVTNTLSDAKQSRIKSLIASGKSQEEVAKILGVSTSTVNKYK